MAKESNRESLHEIFKTGNTIKRIKDINSANAVVFLVDSSFTGNCGSVENILASV
jgi:hypothetical protein